VKIKLIQWKTEENIRKEGEKRKKKIKAGENNGM